MSQTAPAAPRRLRLTIDSRLEDVALVGAAVRAASEAAGVAADVAADVELGVVEIVDNCFEHGYSGAAGFDIDVELSVSAFGVTVVVEDTAPTSPAEALRSAPAKLDFDADVVEDLPEGGMGLMLLKNLMDDVTYRRDGERNVVVFTRRLRVASPATHAADKGAGGC